MNTPTDDNETGQFIRRFVQGQGKRGQRDLIETTLPPAYLLFHFFHLVQITSTLRANEMSSVGVRRWIGLAALLLWFVVAVVQTIRTGTISVPVAVLALFTTAAFVVAVIPPMTVAAWRLHGTWIGITAADGLICYSVLARNRWRIAASGVFLLLVYGIAAAQIDGPRLLTGPQFVATAGNFPAVIVALVGISTIARSALKAKTEAEAQLAVARERNRFHRLIHDAALQPLEALAGGWDVDLNAVRENARQQAVLLRAAIREETGLDDLVLSDRLRELAAQWKGKGLHVDCRLEAPNILLAPSSAKAIVGATAEALANVMKHARTDRAELRSWVRGDRLHVVVADAGRGFDPAKRAEGMGITLSIRDRLREVGGETEITSTESGGTTVTMSVPC